MAFVLEESFEVSAPPDRVWSYLIDPERVAPCLPGARLTEVRDEKTFLGEMTVKVGPVKASYQGEVELVETDEAERRVKMTGKGMEKSGGGSARMTMVSRITSLPDGGSRVVVESELEVAGKLAQFGRGMIEQVGKQIFRQFAECAREELSGDGSAPEDEPGGGAAAAGAATTDPSPAARRTVGEEDDALNLVPVVFSALWEKIRALFGGTRG